MRDCNHRDEGRGDMAKERLKHGSVARKHGAWYWRHYVEGKQKWEKIAEISDRYRSKPLTGFGEGHRGPSNVGYSMTIR